MAIVFDGNGHVGGFTAYLTGDFDVILPTIEVDNNFSYVFSSGSGNSFIQIRSNETRLRLSNGGSTIDAPAISLPAVITDGRITRVGSEITFTFGGNTVTGTSTGPLDIREWGRRGSDGGHLQGKMSGIATIVGDSSPGGVITHDFDGGVQGDTVLTNTTGDYEHGTLIGFATGGYDTASTPTPSVANAGSDQSNINAGDTVTLDSSASTGVVSRSWSEVTATGVTLSDNTAVSPTFTAPSFTELTEITFRVTTTGSDGTTDFDDVSFFVLEDGVTVADPTITLDSKTYSYYTRKADINGEAIFPVSGVITDLPAGAVAEYELDGSGNWFAMPTDSNGNFSDDIIIRVQQNLKVRVSTNTDVVASASYLTAAPIWLAWWQSNESGRGSSTQNSIRNNEITAGMVRPTCFKDGVWQYINDPTSEDSGGGSTWIRIAVEYAKLGQPIGVINVAVGGTGIERWIPSSNDLWDSRIIAETTEADCGGVTYTASLGGESNVGTDGATLRAWLDEMINALHTEFGSTHYLTDIPRTYENGASDTLRAEFDYIIENNPYCRFGGDTEVIDVETDSDGTHLKTGAQINEAALIRFAAFTAPEEVPNVAPTANAGPDQAVAAATQFTLDGTGSQDTDGTIVEWRWTQTAGDTVTLNLEDPARPTATSPSKTTAQRLTFQLVTVDDEGAVSSSSLVNIDVAAVVQNDVLNIIDKISFTFESDGMITAFPGRANRETFRLKPSDPTGLVLEDGWFDFEANDVRRVEISMLETTGVKIISSDTDSITRERSKLHVRMGDMLIKSSTKEFEPTVSVFVGDDERGVVMTAPGLSGAPKVKYYSTTARAI